MSGFVRAGFSFLKNLSKQKTTGTEVIKSVKPDVGKLKKIQQGKKKITDIIDTYASGADTELKKKLRAGSKKSLDRISKIHDKYTKK